MIRSIITKEEQLIALCKSGDRKAQKELYDRFAPLMLSVCKRYLKSLEEAEEVLMTAFMKIFSRIDQFQGNGSFEGWMRRIMVNESLNALKKRKMEFVDDDPEEKQMMVDELDMGKDDVDQLLAMIERLPLGYRTVFNLYAIEGYGHKEIGDQLGISENTSKSQLSKARKNLQAQLSAAEKSLSNG
jgi:RNA polymerase sigma factor (sigma-70 family)